MKKVLLTGIAVLNFSISLLLAQAPQQMSYQAVVRNSNNSLITNTIVAIRISILQSSATGVAVYVETQTPTANADGLVSIEIGNGTVVSGNFSSIDWTSGPYFVKTETDPSGGTNFSISGTSQLLSVPYALYAAKAREQQMLSVNGNQLSISSGNTVTLPSTITSGLYTQYVPFSSINIVNATSETNVDSFYVTYLANNGEPEIGAVMVKKDEGTGVYQINGDGATRNGCGGTGINILGATTFQGGIFYVYTDGCGTDVVISQSGTATLNVSPSNSNGLIFSDGQYIYLNNNSNYLKYSVSGSQLTFVATLNLNTGTNTKAVLWDGTNFFSLNGINADGYHLNKYSPTGVLINEKTVYGSPQGIVNIDSTKIFLISYSNGNIVMTPISKP